MREADLPACEAIGDSVHVAHPEDEGIMAERLRLFPAGCRVLRRGGRVVGYGVSHPWMARSAPALNTCVGRLPDRPDTLFLHDLTLLPEARGRGDARWFVGALLALARLASLPAVSLVAIGGVRGFWEGMGFRALNVPELEAALRTYDAAARYMERWVG